MTDFDDLYGWQDTESQSADVYEEGAREYLRSFFELHRDQVFFSRQLEVQNEDRYFHWITNRAIRELEGEGLIKTEVRKLPRAGTIKLLWHRNYRYYKLEARRLIGLVDEYANPDISEFIGLQGEIMVLDAFARCQFVTQGREMSKFRERVWQQSDHNLDFIFERDDIAYGVEVKNTLGYMNYDEFRLKIRLCKYLNLRPLFVVRMFPRSWMHELINEGGFGLIFKYQLYPWGQRELGRRIAEELGLPIDAPRAIQSGTMTRFLRWHENLVRSGCV
jgi:hypothetical protein